MAAEIKRARSSRMNRPHRLAVQRWSLNDHIRIVRAVAGPSPKRGTVAGFVVIQTSNGGGFPTPL